MSFKIGVWYSEQGMSNQEASVFFQKLYNREVVSQRERPQVYSFYRELCGKFPELEMLSEDEQEDSPWACGHDQSGSHVIMSLIGDQPTSVAATIQEMASRHGLVCYEPQTPFLQLPLHLRPEQVVGVKRAAAGAAEVRV